MITTMTSKGQVTFPKVIRDELHLKKGDKLEFVLQDNGQILIVPLTASVKNLKGMLSAHSKPVSLEDMDEAIIQGALNGNASVP